MPDLEDDFSTFFMNFLGDFLPSFDLFFCVDTTWTREAIRQRRDLTAFSDNRTETSSLPIVLNHEITWNSILISSASRHSTHDNFVSQLNRSQLDWLEISSKFFEDGGSSFRVHIELLIRRLRFFSLLFYCICVKNC